MEGGELLDVSPTVNRSSSSSLPPLYLPFPRKQTSWYCPTFLARRVENADIRSRERFCAFRRPLRAPAIRSYAFTDFLSTVPGYGTPVDIRGPWVFASVCLCGVADAAMACVRLQPHHGLMSRGDMPRTWRPTLLTNYLLRFSKLTSEACAVAHLC